MSWIDLKDWATFAIEVNPERPHGDVLDVVLDALMEAYPARVWCWKYEEQLGTYVIYERHP